jgi:hypothetical protein
MTVLRPCLPSIVVAVLAAVPAFDAAAQVISTSRFYLMIKDPCPDDMWCERALFRLVRKSDCKEFKPRGHVVIHYCASDPPRTPCRYMGHEFQFAGLSYRVNEDLFVWATDQRNGKEVWSEQAQFMKTKSPNPSFQRTGNTCVLPAAEFQR